MRSRPASTVATVWTALRALLRRLAERGILGGLLVLSSALLALLLANSPWADAYFRLWSTPVGGAVGPFSLSRPLLAWVNEGIMALFFLAAGLEIKRELLHSKMAFLSRAALPIAAGLGGLLVPALLYLAVNRDGPETAGWVIPLGTDIIIGLAVLALLDRDASRTLRVFFTCVAVVQHIGVVLLLTALYGNELHWPYLLPAGGMMIALGVMNRRRITQPLLYILPGIILWVGLFAAGIHGTLAGLLLAIAIPVHTLASGSMFDVSSRSILRSTVPERKYAWRVHSVNRVAGTIIELKETQQRTELPLHAPARSLLPFVIYAIMPLVAFANSGVSLEFATGTVRGASVTLGVRAGLLIGTPLGVLLAAWLVTRAGLAAWPAGISWRQILGVGCLAGIGFTTSLYLGALTFADEEFIDKATYGILTASIFAGLAGWLAIRAGPLMPES